MPQPSSARWLAGITAGVLLLAVIAVVVTLTIGSDDPEPLPQGSPEAVVQEFIIAINDGDLRAAYGMLNNDARGQCIENDFGTRLDIQGDSDMRVQLESVNLFDSEASVTVRVKSFSGDPPFGFSERNYSSTFRLGKVGDIWTILNVPSPFGRCGYGQPLPVFTPTPTVTPNIAVTLIPATED